MKQFYLSLLLAFAGAYLVHSQDWVFAEQFASTGNVTPVDIKVDGNGQIYITGNYINELTIGGLSPLPYSDGTGKEDMFLCKFDPDGNALWARQIASTKKDLVGGLAIDPGNNVYVVGAFQGDTLRFSGESTEFMNFQTTGKYDAFIAKYDASGTLVTADSVFYGDNVQRLLDVTYDFTKDYVVVVGQFQGELRYDSSGVKTLPAVSQKDHIVARFDPALGFVDKVVFNGTVKQSVFKNVNNCVIADTVSSYFITGDLVGDLLDAGSSLLISSTDVNYMDIMILKVNDQLAFQWGRKGGSTESYEHINSSGSDAYGNIYFTGKAQSSSITIDSTATLSSAPRTSLGGFQDYLLAKYNRNGNLLWFNRDGTVETDNAYGLSVRGQRILYTGNLGLSSGFSVYDLDGNIIITDSITGDGTETGLNVAFDLSGDSTLIIGSFDGDSLKAGGFRLDNAASGLTDGFLVKYGFKFKVFEVDVQNIECNGESTGSIEVGTEFGTAPVNYAWTPDVSSGTLAEDLPAGTYKIVATDADTRKDSIEIELTENDPILITEDAITPTSCNVLASSGTKNDGGVSISVEGGTGAGTYSYLWSGGSGFVQGQQDQSTLTAGTYYLTVTDGNGCTKLDTFLVTQPTKVSHGGSIVDTITVPPGDNGAVHLNTYGGTPAYSFSWTGPPGFIPSSEDTIKDLQYGGDYDLQVTDGNSCVFDTTFVVPVDTGLSITICDYRHVSCKDDEDGYAKVCVVLGGSGSYSYAWRTSGGTPVGTNDDELTGVPDGTYIVKVTDLLNLTTAETSISIEEPGSYLSIGLDSTWTPSCYGDNDGVVFITANGGWGSYSYLWTPTSKTDQDLFNVPAGTYSVQVADTGLNTGTCVKQLTDIPLSQPNQLMLEISEYQSITCNGSSNGQLRAAVTGGTKPYGYVWDDPGAQNDSIATDLAASLYEVSVTDANGCSENDQKLLGEPAALAIQSLNLVSPSWSVLSDGQVSVEAAGGTRDYVFALNSGSFGPDSVFTGLGIGSDTLRVDDANGCGPVQQIVNITAPDPDPISLADTNITQVLCKGDNSGAICVTPAGGIGVYYYTWTGSAVTDSCIDGLAAGTYMVSITDIIWDTLEVSLKVTEPAEGLVFTSITIDSADNNNDMQNGSIELAVSGGTAPYQYFLDDALQAGSLMEDLAPGSYTVRVDDAVGCSTGDSSVVVEDRAVAVQDLEGYSNILIYPNPSTGQFTIELNNEKGEDLMLEILNLTGQIVYKKMHEYNGNTRFTETIDLSEKAKGTYFMRVNGLPVKAKLMIE